MSQLYSAMLNPTGPNFLSWHDIFRDADIALKSPESFLATLGEEKNVEVFALDLGVMTLGQKARLLSKMSQKFRVPIHEVEAQFVKQGFPIRAIDVIVSVSLRAAV